jgi:molybdate transport system permease protein
VIVEPLWLSIKVTLLATAVASTFGIALAYALTKSRFRGRSMVEALFTLPIVLPPTVLGYYLLSLIGARSSLGGAWKRVTGTSLAFTPTAAVIAATISALPYIVRTARAAFENVDPRLEAAMRVAGHSEWRVARFVTLPLARRGLGAGVALGFARALGDFGATVMVAGNIPGRTQTLPVAVYDAVQGGRQSDARNGALILLAIAVFALLAVTALTSRERVDTRRTR